MQIIEIIVENKKYQIEWALSEHFDELRGMKFMLNNVAADQIVKINNLSETAKILLSAVADIAFNEKINIINDKISNNLFFNFVHLYLIVK